MRLARKSSAPKSPFYEAFGWPAADSGGSRLRGSRAQAASRIEGMSRDEDLSDFLKSNRIAALEAEVDPQSDIVRPRNQDSAEHGNGGRKDSLAASKPVAIIGQIVAMSERLFPGPVSFEQAFDPENPSDEWLVFDVVAQGEYKDYRDREFQWYEEVERIVPDSLCEFRLCVMPQR